MKKRFIEKLPVSVAIMLTLLGTQLAETVRAEDTEPSGVSVFTLGEIEVSGKADGNKNKTIDRVDAETIRDFNRNTVADAANLIPGVTASVTGARSMSKPAVLGVRLCASKQIKKRRFISENSFLRRPLCLSVVVEHGRARQKLSMASPPEKG